MRIKMRLARAIGALSTAAGAPAMGAVIYDNGVPDPMFGGGFSDLDADARQGDGFVLTPGATEITGFRWYGFYGPSIPESDDFTIAIYATMGGLPVEPAAHVFAVGDVGRSPGPEPGSFVYEATIPALTLDASTLHVLSIYNNTPPGFENDWAWFNSGEGSGFIWLGDFLIPSDRELAFAILGVPGPGAVITLALGAAAIGPRRARRAV